VLQAAWRSLEARANLSKNIGVSEQEFLAQVFRSIDTTGTTLEKVFPPKAVAEKTA
jgi:mutual gliding-motility protein MglA